MSATQSPSPPKQPPFHASAVKIKQAKKHLATLTVLTEEYVASKPVRHEPMPDHAGIGFTTHMRGPPEEYGAVLGDVMHNLRAALDLMACDLVRTKGGSAKNVLFPFCDEKKDLNHMIKRRHFDRAGAEAVALLKSLEPYHGGNAALRAVHDLDIQDKHQELIPTAMSWVSPVFKIDRFEGRIAHLSLVPETIDKTELTLRFPPGTVLEGKEIIPTLHELVQLTEGIVEAFKALREVPGVDVDAARAHDSTAASKNDATGEPPATF